LPPSTAGQLFWGAGIAKETTTDTPPETIYQTGLRESQRIWAEMAAVKKQARLTSDLTAFSPVSKAS